VSSGVFERIFQLLASDADNEYDDRCHHCARSSTPRRSSKKDGDKAIGRSRGRLTTKNHALTDALDNPANLMLTIGQIHDLACGPGLIENADPEALIADKPCRADPLINSLGAINRARNPPNATERPNAALYCERNLIERFFNKIKHFRAIATRYDKLARNFLAAVQLVSAIILLN
jgi:transposase